MPAVAAGALEGPADGAVGRDRRRSVGWKLMPVFVAAVVVVGAGIWIGVPRAIRAGVEADAVAGAERTVQQFKQLRAYYTEKVVAKALKAGMPVNFDHAGKEGTIPLPATMIHDLSAQLSKDGTRIGLYSPYPFPNRKDRQLDAFGQQAWDFLTQSPDRSFTRVETVDGKSTVRVGVADTLTGQACVACHNTRADSPKKDWKLGDLRGVLEVAVSIDEPLARAERLSRSVALAVVAAFAAIGGIVGWLLRRLVLKPMAGLTAAMASLARREWTTAVPETGRRDEIGTMAAAVQVFKDNGIENDRLQREAEEARRQRAEQDRERHRLEQEARDADQRRQQEQAEAARRAEAERLREEERMRAEAAERRRQELAALADDFERRVKSMVESVTAAAGKAQSASGDMSRTAEQTSQRAAAVAAASEEASTNVQAVAAAAEELAQSIREISGQVSDSAARTQGAVGAAQKASGIAEGLAAAAQKIGDVVGLINTIAAQTNLLALNATIEAARAGEAGKGFAVVASEVKSLATQTSRATEEIVGQVQAIQQSTGAVSQAIRDVTQAIGAANEIANAIAAAIEEQGAATQEISRNVQEASKGTGDVSRNIAGVTEATAGSRAAAQELHQASTALFDQSRRLGGEVERFIARVRAG
jgi:methyl-accepting chemotaxis protein